jgi:predicted HAD superfamily Cof-like phosphohydrolase
MPDLVKDVEAFSKKFGQPSPSEPRIDDLGYLIFRIGRLVEEVHEADEALRELEEDKSDINAFAKLIDALVDTVYIAIGTATSHGVDFSEAWRRVHEANMAKERAVNTESKWGIKWDIVKPEGWTAPNLIDLVLSSSPTVEQCVRSGCLSADISLALKTMPPIAAVAKSSEVSGGELTSTTA